MTGYSLYAIIGLSGLLLITSCNQQDKTPAPVVTVPDTVKKPIVIVPPSEDADTGVIDFSKRIINLNAAEWQAFVTSNKINTTAATTYTISGKFKTGEGQQTLHIVPPVADTVTKDAFQECIGGCDTYIVSSDNSMPVLKVNSNLGGYAKTIADLDGDGAAEIMVYPDWWQSNWNAYTIYSYNSTLNKWSYLIEPISIFANELDKKMRFVKPSSKKGYLSAYTSEMIETDVISKYKDYKIIK